MKNIGIALGLSILMVAACTKETDKSYDGQGRVREDLSQMKGGLWVDPNGCQHWIIDDGFEGYMSARLDENGKAMCDPRLIRNSTFGNYKASGTIPDY